LISFRRNTSANDGHHAICRTAQLSALTELRDFVESAAIHSGLKHDDVFAFKLAVDEICTNIIQYGYEGREAGSISLFFDVEKDQARLIIQDDGIFFSPEQAQDPDIEADWNERQVGGLGIFFVQELMDNVIYNQVNGNINRFVLEKKLITSNTTKE